MQDIMIRKTEALCLRIIVEKRRKAFVSDIFKNIVETNNLSGFIFKLVWDSDET